MLFFAIAIIMSTNLSVCRPIRNVYARNCNIWCKDATQFSRTHLTHTPENTPLCKLPPDRNFKSNYEVRIFSRLWVCGLSLCFHSRMNTSIQTNNINNWGSRRLLKNLLLLPLKELRWEMISAMCLFRLPNTLINVSMTDCAK